MAERRGRSLRLAALSAGLLWAGAAQAQEPARLMLVMDGSGSMWERLEGRPKLEIAREGIGEALRGLTPGREIGLTSFGHRRKGDCGDVELVVPPAAGAAEEVFAVVDSMRFLGKTPLAGAARLAAEALSYEEAPATLLIVTDGGADCAPEACAQARELAEKGAALRIHVASLGRSPEAGAGAACFAEATGGRRFQAQDAAELAAGLREALAAEGAFSSDPEEGESFVFEEPALHPGAEWMADAALEATGSGETRGDPRGLVFLRKGTAEDCAAFCASDSACAGWSFEPAGDFPAARASCGLFDYRAELDYVLVDAGLGWAAGLKPDAARLIRPWEAAGAAPQAAPLEAALAAPPGYEDRPVVWSAEPMERQAFEAMAMPYPTVGDFETAFEPGLWKVWGEGAGFALAGEIRVTPESGTSESGRRFVIPLDPTPFDFSTPAFFCDGAETCEFEDALTGLAFALPPGWSAGPAWFYETAGGARADLPTVEFYGPGEEEASAVSLNLRQAGQGGRCEETAAGSLCLRDPEAPGAGVAFALLKERLAMGEPWLGPEEDED